MTTQQAVNHEFSYTALTCGYPAVSHTTCNIVGLEVDVYGLDEIRSSPLPLGILIATHGRLGNKTNMASFAQGIIGCTAEIASHGSQKRKRDLIVVSLDHRNHGKRESDPTANLSFNKNPAHLTDMAALIVGAKQDVSFIIDFIAAYLFPNGEKVVEEYMATGISLGGHATWLLLREDPRIQIGVPIIGLPFESYPRLMKARAESLGLEFKAPVYPPSLQTVLERPIPEGTYRGKKILTLHGRDDPLVPYAKGEAEIEYVQADAKAGDVDIWVQEWTGHVCTPEMVQKAAQWIWKWGLSSGGEKNTSSI
ncbi:hypothetical protein P7C73_g716, partial [Tremellales sp. Uapishka_1]